jgi:FolB domain-containing protein
MCSERKWQIAAQAGLGLSHKSHASSFNRPTLKMSTTPSYQTDIVFINALQLSVDVGPDCWGRPRAQPVNLTVYLHLRQSYLTTAGRSDDVRDSIHYGHLSKAILRLVEKKAGSSFGSVQGLIEAVTQEGFAMAGEAAVEVRVVVELPKLIQLAGGFCVDATTPRDTEVSSIPRKVSITELVLPVIIGVNPPERVAKQLVVTNIDFFENAGSSPSPDYQEIVSRLSKVRSTFFQSSRAYSNHV